MNGKPGWSRGWKGAVAVVLASVVAGSLGGCKLLKPKEKKAFGADCQDDLDCESLTCSTTGNICSKSCTYDKDCGGDLVCRRKDDGSGQWCSKAVGTAPNGSCMTTSDCQHNQCLKYVGKDDQPGICSKFCGSPDDCPDGMKICAQISDSGLLKVCIPGDPKADPSSRPQFAPAPITPRGKAPVAHPPPHPPPPAPPPAPAHPATPAKHPVKK